MMNFTNQIEIARPIGDVFSYLEDFTNVPQWNYWVTKVEQTTAGPVTVGTIFHQTRRDDDQRYTVIEHDPPRRLSVRTLDGDRPAFRRTMLFEATDGTTRITDEWQLDTGHPEPLQRLATSKTRRAVATNLAALRDLLETGRVSLPDGRQISLR